MCNGNSPWAGSGHGATSQRAAGWWVMLRSVPCCPWCCRQDGGRTGATASAPVAVEGEAAASEPAGQRSDGREDERGDSILPFSGLCTASCSGEARPCSARGPCRQPPPPAPCQGHAGPPTALFPLSVNVGESDAPLCWPVPQAACRASGEVLALHHLVLHQSPPPVSTSLEHRAAPRPETRSARFGTARAKEIPLRE